MERAPPTLHRLSCLKPVLSLYCLDEALCERVRVESTRRRWPDCDVLTVVMRARLGDSHSRYGPGDRPGEPPSRRR
eukprot:5058472-Prymnesium_polylepis.1